MLNETAPSKLGKGGSKRIEPKAKPRRQPVPRAEFAKFCRSRDSIEIAKKFGLPDRQVPDQGQDVWWIYDRLTVDDQTGAVDSSVRLYIAFERTFQRGAVSEFRVCADVQFDP